MLCHPQNKKIKLFGFSESQVAFSDPEFLEAFLPMICKPSKGHVPKSDVSFAKKPKKHLPKATTKKPKKFGKFIYLNSFRAFGRGYIPLVQQP